MTTMSPAFALRFERKMGKLIARTWTREFDAVLLGLPLERLRDAIPIPDRFLPLEDLARKLGWKGRR